MLNIISYFDNILRIEEEIKDEGHTLITTLQEISIKNYNNIFGYNYKNPDEKEIDILKKVTEDILLIIDDIRNNTKQIKVNNNNLMLNSIRRILLSEIEIINNSTFMPDEVWKQRIELIPIKIIDKNKEINLNNLENNYFELNKEYDNKSNNYVTSNNLINTHNNLELVYNDIIIKRV